MGNLNLPKLATGVTENPASYIGTPGEMTYSVDTMTVAYHDDNKRQGGNILLPASFGGLQNFSTGPFGNPIETFSSHQLIANTKPEHAAKREFMANFGFASDHGYGVSDPVTGLQGDKVTLYVGMRGRQGTTDFWAANILSVIETTDAVNSHCVEFDANINNGNKYGAGRGSGGASLAGGQFADGSTMPNVSAKGIAITGGTIGGGTLNVGCLVGGLSPLFQSGFATGPYGGIQNGYLGASVATCEFRAAGANFDAFNTESASLLGSALHIGNGQKITAGTSPVAARYPLIQLDASNNLLLGYATDMSSVANIVVNSSILPVTDNAIQLGAGGRRFATIWAATGTIQTSDPSTKNFIGELPGATALAIVNAVPTMEYRFKEGGQTIERVAVEREAEVMEDFDEIVQDFVAVDGGLTLVERVVPSKRPVYDDVPLLDANGAQIIDTFKPGDPNDAEITHVPRVRKVVRRQMQTVVEEVAVTREGVRVHAGFDASVVKDALAAQGRDLGAYVKDETGLEGLRADELNAILWSAVRQLSAKVDRLESH